MNKNRAGLTLAVAFGLLHLIWSILVAAGAAQPLVNFVAKMHFMTTPPQIGTFDFGTAIGLIVLTSLGGYVLGWLLAAIWLKMGSRK